MASETAAEARVTVLAWALILFAASAAAASHASVRPDDARARIPALDLVAILMVQYFHGYGESLLAYERKSSTLRIGLAFVR